MAVELPIDHLLELWPAKFRGARVGALIHPASVSSKLEHASRILERYNGDLFRLAAFFGPQHGFLGQTQDNMWNGRVTNIRVCTSRSTVFTANIANRPQKCYKAWIFCWSI